MAARTEKPKQFASRCLALFGLPFCVAGFVALYVLFPDLQHEAIDGERAILLGACALTFLGAGIGLIFLYRYAAAKAQEIERLKQLYPDAPWKWREDWASGCIVATDKSKMLFAWIFTAFWNLVSAPVLFILPQEFLEKGNELALVALIFSLAGLGLLTWAIRATRTRLHRSRGSTILTV